MNNKREFMNIPYEVNDYGFTCKYFNFYPYHIMSFSTKTEDEMKDRIKEYVENRVKYERKYKLHTNAAAEFYQELNYKGD
jgi:hypothetical protein